MNTHEIRSIEIDTDYDHAFHYIADPRNLPRWAEAFASADDERAVLRTPSGEAEIALRVDASPEHGTIDWTMTFPDGTAARAHSRLTRGDRLVYAFVLHAPPVPLEQLEGALAAQVKTLESELARLKRVLEGRDAG
jgi:hypothetical protein